MLDLDRILNDDRLIRALTGLNRKGFEALLPSFEATYQQRLIKPDQTRQRGFGGGRKARLLTIEYKLFYILLYCKCYPTMDLLSAMFAFERSCACDWVHSLLPVLEQTLGYKQVLPARKLRSMAEFVALFPDVKTVILDGTERPVQRPQDAEQQKEHYSGKKRRHTRKHITGTTRNKRVILLTPAQAGKIHDKRQLQEAELVEYIPDEVNVEGDLGFRGLQNEFVNIHLPHKKPRGKELSDL